MKNSHIMRNSVVFSSKNANSKTHFKNKRLALVIFSQRSSWETDRKISGDLMTFKVFLGTVVV